VQIFFLLIQHLGSFADSTLNHNGGLCGWTVNTVWLNASQKGAQKNGTARYWHVKHQFNHYSEVNTITYKYRSICRLSIQKHWPGREDSRRRARRGESADAHKGWHAHKGAGQRQGQGSRQERPQDQCPRCTGSGWTRKEGVISGSLTPSWGSNPHLRGWWQVCQIRLTDCSLLGHLYRHSSMDNKLILIFILLPLLLLIIIMTITTLFECILFV